MLVKLSIHKERRKEMCEAKTLLKALGILMVVCLFPGCGGEPIPPEMIGTWTTSAPGYERASMEITAETITFKDGKGYAGVNRIIGIEKKKENDETLYKLSYEGDEGVRFVLSFYLKQVRRGKGQHKVIVYKNQEDLTWTKQAG
jgi:hypothetical protein